MKKIVLMLLCCSLFLFGCGASEQPAEEVPAEPQVEEVQPEPVEEPAQAKEWTVDNIKNDIIAMGIGEGDTINKVSFDNREIYAELEIVRGQDIGLPDKDVAMATYGAISDTLLDIEELNDKWDVLTVDFKGLGTISMKQDQAVKENGMRYFKSAEYGAQLK